MGNRCKISKKLLGNFGDIGTYSFDFAKTLTTGEGGMIVFKKKIIYLQKRGMIMDTKIIQSFLDGKILANHLVLILE